MVDYELENEIADKDYAEMMEIVEYENNEAAAEAEYMAQVMQDWCDIEL